MAEKVEIIEIDAGTATKTLKELKDEVKDLRRQLDDCEIGSDKFAKTLDELTTAQTELKNATKSSNEALEGSYDALTAKMAELKKAWRATADEAERADLGQQIASINDQLKDMDASIGNYQRNVGNYGSAFDNVTMKIEGGVARFEKFEQGARSIVGSLDLVEGGLKAMGVESEAAEEALDKMKSVMVITNGLSSIKEGVVAFNSMRTAVQGTTAAQTVLNAVMSANPIGLILTAVAALGAAVAYFVSESKKAEQQLQRMKSLADSYSVQAEQLETSEKRELALMKARDETEEKILERRLHYANENEKLARDTYLKMQKEYNAASKKTKEEMQSELDAAKDAWLNSTKVITDIKIEQDALVEQRKRERQEKWNEYLKNQAKYETDLEIQKWKEKEQIELAAIEAAKARRKQEIEDAKNDYKSLLETLRTAHMTEQELEMDAAENEYFRMQDVLHRAMETGEISMEKFVEKMLEVDNLHAETVDAIIAKYEELENPLPKLEESTKKVTWATMEMGDKINSMAGLAGTAFGQATQLLNTLAAQQDKTSEEGFENYKKLSYGAAVMSMLQGIISSWTSAMSLPAPISFITGGVMTAATATLGALQIDSIKRQSFNGSSGSTPSASAAMPNINTASLLSTPINYTSEVKGANAIEDATDTRVYVVESDITDTVNKVRVAEDESTF